MGAPARINARLDEALAEKVDEIRRATKQSTTEVVITALEQYHERIQAQAQAYPSFSEAGFIGCAEGPADLSTDYKRLIDYANKGVARAPAKRRKP
jgi:predicted transcriptional regulator